MARLSEQAQQAALEAYLTADPQCWQGLPT